MKTRWFGIVSVFLGLMAASLTAVLVWMLCGSMFREHQFDMAYWLCALAFFCWLDCGRLYSGIRSGNLQTMSGKHSMPPSQAASLGTSVPMKTH